MIFDRFFDRALQRERLVFWPPMRCTLFVLSVQWSPRERFGKSTLFTLESRPEYTLAFELFSNLDSRIKFIIHKRDMFYNPRCLV